MALDLTAVANLLGISVGVLLLAVVWSLIWKGLALWISARKRSKVWFIILLLVNTLGILEILYIFIFSKLQKSRISDSHQKSKRFLRLRENKQTRIRARRKKKK